MQNENKIKIDNAGLIYPCSATKTYQSIHRISAEFYDELNVELMQKALDKVIKRFPTFQIKLKKGFFWNYFEKTDEMPKVEVTDKICRFFDLKNDFLFRIICNKKILAIETFHAVADGSGSMRFLNTLIATYLSFKGEKISSHASVLNLDEAPKASETDDDFFKFYDKKGKRNARKEETAYQIHGNKQEELSVFRIDLNLQKFKTALEDTNYTLNHVLLAIYFQSILQEKKLNGDKSKKPIKISLPVDLRHYYGNQTLRNFSGYINLRIDSTKEYDLEKLLELIKEQTSQSNKDFYQHNINANISLEKNPFIRFIPRILKDRIISFCFSHFGECLYTTIFSNMGKASGPVEFEKYIAKYECLVGASKVNSKCLCCIGYKNNLNITMTGKIKENTLEKLFVENLKKCALC